MVAGVIAVLAGIVLANVGQGSAQARDAERLSDIRSVEAALERYRLKYGRYPAGCNDPNPDSSSVTWNDDWNNQTGNWSGEPGMGAPYECPDGSSEYIVGLAPEFIPTLPRDPLGARTGVGYVYTVNQYGEVYKFMALNSVEEDSVGLDHEFARCEPYVNDPSSGNECSLILRGTIFFTATSDISPEWESNPPDRCDEPSQFGNDYAVSAGYASRGRVNNTVYGNGNNQDKNDLAREYFTDAIRCK